MPLDPELVAETLAWLERAARDLEAGAVDLAASTPLTGDAAFHAQQAAEKSMKALLTWHSHVFRKTHNLIELGAMCAELDSSLETLLRRAAVLTDYTWRFRYPGAPADPQSEEAQSALALAREVHDAILDRLPTDVRP